MCYNKMTEYRANPLVIAIGEDDMLTVNHLLNISSEFKPTESIKSLCSYAKSLPMLELLYKRGHPLELATLFYVFKRQRQKGQKLNMDMLNWLIEHNCPSNVAITNMAIKLYDIKLVKLLVDKGFKLDNVSFEICFEYHLLNNNAKSEELLRYIVDQKIHYGSFELDQYLYHFNLHDGSVLYERRYAFRSSAIKRFHSTLAREYNEEIAIDEISPQLYKLELDEIIDLFLDINKKNDTYLPTFIEFMYSNRSTGVTYDKIINKLPINICEDIFFYCISFNNQTMAKRIVNKLEKVNFLKLVKSIPREHVDAFWECFPYKSYGRYYNQIFEYLLMIDSPAANKLIDRIYVHTYPITSHVMQCAAYMNNINFIITCLFVTNKCAKLNNDIINAFPEWDAKLIDKLEQYVPFELSTIQRGARPEFTLYSIVDQISNSEDIIVVKEDKKEVTPACSGCNKIFKVGYLRAV